MQLPDEDVMYKALVSRDQDFEGVFYTAVKTTGVFCRPTCPARKPKRENVEFFRCTKEALDHGYRPCKRCKPMQLPAATPDWVGMLEDQLSSSPEAKIRDQDLRALSLDPAKIRRWFKHHHGMTFQAYQRSLRLNQAFGHLRAGKSVTEVAFQSGYDSLSGFQDAFQKAHDEVPSRSNTLHAPVVVRRIVTPLGPMLAGVHANHICLLEFADRRMLETQIDRLKKHFGCSVVAGLSALHKRLEVELQRYFEGSLQEFSVPIQKPGTPFQMEVWEALRKLPYGSTSTYLKLAKSIGRENSVRAVASANGDNRISIIIPCHRIIGSDGTLRGYGGGLWRKKWLLEHEQQASRRLHRIM